MADTRDTALFDPCDARVVLDQVANKWSIMILSVLCTHPTRFNAMKRRLDGITHKALTEALRRLERNGLVTRRVIASSPVAVEYSITPLGRTLQEPFLALYAWSAAHRADIEHAQHEYDHRGANEMPRLSSSDGPAHLDGAAQT